MTVSSKGLENAAGEGVGIRRKKERRKKHSREVAENHRKHTKSKSTFGERLVNVSIVVSY